MASFDGRVRHALIRCIGLSEPKAAGSFDGSERIAAVPVHTGENDGNGARSCHFGERIQKTANRCGPPMPTRAGLETQYVTVCRVLSSLAKRLKHWFYEE